MVNWCRMPPGLFPATHVSETLPRSPMRSPVSSLCAWALPLEGDHGIIASKRCDHLSVKDNVAYNNGGSGIMLHRSCDYSVVEGEWMPRRISSSYAGLLALMTLWLL